MNASGGERKQAGRNRRDATVVITCGTASRRHGWNMIHVGEGNRQKAGWVFFMDPTKPVREVTDTPSPLPSTARVRTRRIWSGLPPEWCTGPRPSAPTL